jgi:hypothetical protein
MRGASAEMDRIASLPIIARVAGLPADAVDRFASDLPKKLPDIEEAEKLLTQARAELVKGLHLSIQGAPGERRRYLLGLKRDSFNGRSVRSHRGSGAEPWAGVPETLVPLVESVASLEDLQERLQQELEAAYDRQIERERGALRGFLTDAYFLRGVALSSSVLLENLPRLAPQAPIQGSGRRVRRLEVSMLRYVSRAALKLSPFSTLTRIGLASAVQQTGGLDLELVDPARWRERSTVRLQRFIPEQVADLLTRYPAFRTGLRVSLNETLEKQGADSFRFIRPGRWNEDPATKGFQFDMPALVTAKLRGPVVEWLREGLASRPMIYTELLAGLQAAFPSHAETALCGSLDRLLGLGFVCWNQPWEAFDLAPEMRLLEYLRSLTGDEALGEIALTLEHLLSLLAAYAGSASPGGVAAVAKKATRELAGKSARLAGIDPAFASGPSHEWFFQEDVFLESDLPAGDVAHLDSAEALELLTELAPLSRLSNLYNSRHDFQHALSAFASTRWADQGEVPFLDVFEAAYPLFRGYVKHEVEARSGGYLQGSVWNPSALPAVESLRGWRETVLKALPGCLGRDGDTVRLDRTALEELLDSAPETYTALRDFAAFLQPVAGRGERWVLNVLSDGMGRTSSRYTAAMSATSRERFTSFFVDNSVGNGSEDRGEFVDLVSAGGHTANIHAPQTRRVLIAPGQWVGLPPDRILTPRDLTVRLLGPDRFPILVDRSGQRVLPVHLGAIAFRYLPSLTKFLALFGPCEMRFCKPLQERLRGEGVEIVQRHAAGSIVYQRKAWTFEVQKMQATLAGLSSVQAFRDVNRWRVHHGLPDRVYIAEPLAGTGNNPYSKPQYIDFTSGLFVELFRAILNRGLPRLRIFEALPTPEEIPLYRCGARMAVEIQLESSGLRLTSGRAPSRVMEGSSP